MSQCQGHCLLPRQQDPMTDRSDRSIPEGVVSGMKCLLHMETERKRWRQVENGKMRGLLERWITQRERGSERICVFIYIQRILCMYVDSYYILLHISAFWQIFKVCTLAASVFRLNKRTDCLFYFTSLFTSLIHYIVYCFIELKTFTVIEQSLGR